MNTASVTLLCWVLAQVPSPQFSPTEEPAPLRPTTIISGSSPVLPNESAGGYRIQDEAADASRYVPPQAIHDSPPARPQRDLRQVAPPQALSPAQSRPHQSSPVSNALEHDALANANRMFGEAMRLAGTEGEPVPLVDVLKQGDSGSRERAVRAYWQLCGKVAEQGFAAAEIQSILQLPQPQTPLEQAVWQANLARAEAWQADVALAVLLAQQQLAELIRFPDKANPLPADAPYIGPYRTSLEAIFDGRPIPLRLRQIDQTLPSRLEVVERLADAVAASEQLVAQLGDAYRGQTVRLEQVLDSLEELSDLRRRFTVAVLAYNQQIAEYSMAVVSPTVGAETLLGTLIRTEQAAPTMLADSKVRPASAEQPVPAEPDHVDDEPTSLPRLDTPTSPRAADFERTQSILKRLDVSHD